MQLESGCPCGPRGSAEESLKSIFRPEMLCGRGRGRRDVPVLLQRGGMLFRELHVLCDGKTGSPYVVVLTHQLAGRSREQWFSGKEDGGVAQPVLALWLGKWRQTRRLAGTSSRLLQILEAVPEFTPTLPRVERRLSVRPVCRTQPTMPDRQKQHVA